MTIGQSTVAISGTLDVVTTRRTTLLALTQSIGGVEVKGPQELTIAAGATVDVPLPFSSGVDEALFLAIYSPRKVNLSIVDGNEGVVSLGLKGYYLHTYTPGKGLAGLQVSNPSISSAVTIEYVYAAKADATDSPDYWNDDE